MWINFILDTKKCLLLNLLENILNLLNRCSQIHMSFFKMSFFSIFFEKHPKDISLICLGPLTNIALAIKTYPEIKENIKSVFIMGGNYKGIFIRTVIVRRVNSLIHFLGRFNQSLIYQLILSFSGVGNATACAEFNFHMDPESAHIVLESLSCPKTIVPWECCIKESINISLVNKSFMKINTKSIIFFFFIIGMEVCNFWKCAL